MKLKFNHNRSLSIPSAIGISDEEMNNVQEKYLSDNVKGIASVHIQNFYENYTKEELAIILTMTQIDNIDKKG